MPANQPTILVKKADGTSVRLTMEEFRKYQETKKLGNSEIKKSEIEEIKQLPATSSEALATSAPVKEIWVDEAIFKKTLKQKNIKTKPVWTSEDHQSLLEEKVAEKPKVEMAAALPPARGEVFSRVVKVLKFPVGDNLLPRLQSLIVSRAKDIRTDEQVKEYALRAADKGGLGLSEVQAGELMKAIGGELDVRGKRDEERGTGKEIKKFRNLEIEKIEEKTEDRRYEIGDKTIDRKRSFAGGRPVLHDVTPPPAPPMAPEEKRTVSPVDELAGFTLTDFRRLSSKPEEAGKILQEKLAVLQKDSYLLYLKGLESWYNSPLYREYLRAAEQALGDNKKLREILALGSKDGLQEEEFMAIVAVNFALS